ncbi:MAG: rod shape-determining protein RodA [Bacteroidetes bacterium]|nr:rod shape-determining protein RodA [Bacteroidota bacterium]
MRERRGIFEHIDWWLVILYLLLVGLGWINIYAAVYDINHSDIVDMHVKYGKQMLWIFAAVFLAMIILLIDGKFFAQFSNLIYGICILLLIMVIFSGKEISGSKSWFQFAGVALQPAEFAKMGTALALAKFLSLTETDIRKRNDLFLAAGIILLPTILVILQHDTGSALVFLSFILVLYRAGLSDKFLIAFVLVPMLAVLSLLINKFIIVGGLFLIAVLVFLYTKRRFLNTLIIAAVFLAATGFVFSVNYGVNHVLEPHQRTRINVLIGKEIDLKGAGYNVNQSLIAIGSGGMWGKGFLQGTQTKYNFVPEQSTDFIFCTVGEEWGFLKGSLVVVGLFVVLLIRIVIVAERQRSRFSRFYGYGVAAIIFFHFFINIGMTLGLLPVIGIPLPFFSYGGSSLWAFTMLLFIFIRQDSYRYELL